MRHAPTFLAFLLELGIGLLIALAFMEGQGFRAGLYGGLAVLVGIALYLARLDRIEHEQRVPAPERHVSTGQFRGSRAFQTRKDRAS